jgi:hypothetical protein
MLEFRFVGDNRNVNADANANPNTSERYAWVKCAGD